MMSFPKSIRCWLAGGFSALLLLVQPGFAADAEFVGILAIAAEADVAKELGLSAEQQQKLTDVIDQRVEDVTGLALELRKLPPAERRERLRPFVADSEKQGLALLTPVQLQKLEQIQLVRQGVSALLRPTVAAQVGLTAEQQTKLEALSAEMDGKLAGVPEAEARITRIVYQRQMNDLLNNDQRTSWQKLTGQIKETQVAALQEEPVPGDPDYVPPKSAPGEDDEDDPEPMPSAGEGTKPAAEPAPMPAPATSEGTPDPDLTKPTDAEEAPAETPKTGTTPATTPPAGTPGTVPGTGVRPGGSGFPPRSGSTLPPAGTGRPGSTPGATPGTTLPAGVPTLPTTRGTSNTESTGPAEKIKFNFSYAPWKSVLEWFAEQADLSLVMDSPPAGTFNYSDRRSYTPEEGLDLINGILVTKGYTLLRRERMLMLLNLEDPIPPSIIDQVTPDQLEGKGKYELLSCLFTLTKMAPEDAESELRKMLGPQGSLQVLPKAKQVYITETAGKLRLIKRAIEAVENPSINEKDENVTTIPLQYVSPGEFLALARPLLGIPENLNAAPDGSLRMAVDELSGRLLVTGKPERVKKLQDLVAIIDIQAYTDDGASSGGPLELPQLEIYTISVADPTSVLQVISTMLAGLPDVRLALDPKTNNLIALARPSQHATIVATLDQLQSQAKQVEVIKLRTVDPQVAVLAITKMFGASTEGGGGGPTIDADPNTMQLLVRGSAGEVAQIRDLLKKMGETDWTDEEYKAERSNYRVINNLTGRAADSALGQLEMIWPTVRENKIRVRVPATSPGASEIDQRRTPNSNLPLPGRALPPDSRPETSAEPTTDRDAAVHRRTRAVFVSQIGTQNPVPQPAAGLVPTVPVPVAPPGEPAAVPMNPAAPAVPAAAAPAIAEDPASEIPASEPPATEAKPEKKSVPGAEIVVTQGPNGLIIASDDLDALDEFETMLRSIAETTTATGREYTIFYLKYAKADGASELLQQAMGVTPSSDSGGGGGGGGGGLFGDIAQGVLGDSGGLLGGLLGLGGGGGGSSSDVGGGTVTIIPDMRLNALLVHAGSKDLDTMEQLLKVIDQPFSPEDVQTVARPRLIPVLNTDAQTVADVLKQVYSGRLQAEAGGQQRQPSPQELIQALRGGRGGGGQQQRKSEEQKVTIGVDVRTNSLIVSAPDYLFGEIGELVEQLDTASVPSNETVQVVTLKRANADTVQRTIAAVLGEKIQLAAPATPGGSTTSRSTQSRSTGSSSDQRSSSQSGGNPQDTASFLQDIQRLQQGGGGSGRGSSGRGGGGFGGGSGGFGGGRGGR